MPSDPTPPPPPGPGPVHARLISDPTVHAHAPPDSKFALELAFAEEKLATFRSNDLRVVDKGALPTSLLAHLPRVEKKEHTRLWHVVYDEEGEWKGKVKIVYVFVHVEGGKEREGEGMKGSMKVLEEELRGLKGGGRLRDGRAFSVAQVGTKVAFGGLGG